MYDCKLYRLNIKGIKSTTKDNKLTLSIVPFVPYGYDNDCTYAESSTLERDCEITMEIDLNNFYSDTHKTKEELLKDLSLAQWFKTKNVVVEHSFETNKHNEIMYETFSVLSNTANDLEMIDMLYFGFETNTNGGKSYFCNFNLGYFKNTQDCPFIKNAFVSLNKTNKKVIAPLMITKEVKNEQNAKSFIHYYSSKKEALETITKSERKEGEHVWVKLAKSKPKMYTWVGGIEDKNLIVV